MLKSSAAPRIIMIMMIVIVVSLAGMFIINSEPENHEEPAPSALAKDEGASIRWGTLLEKQGNEVTLQVKAEKAVFSVDKEKVWLTNFSMVSHGQSGDKVTIIAKLGELASETKDVAAEGGVLVMDGDGRAMYTERLQWYDGSKRLVTDHPVRIFGDNFLIKGRRLEVETNIGRARIYDGVTAIFQRR